MSLKFIKMHGLGNDFMVIDGVNQKVTLNRQKIAALSRRDTGVGFDQCLVVEPSNEPNIDFFYRIYNSDGSEVGQCGNGARCLARFVEYLQLSHKRVIRVATKTTQMALTLNDDHTVTVDMGLPEIVSKPHSLAVDGQSYSFHELSLGNPHAVLITENIISAPVQTLGSSLSTHPYFPEQCNIGFMQIMDSEHVKLRVFERACGETQACGSGAVAAAAIGMRFYGLAEQLRVELPGGELMVSWPEKQSSIFLTGGATFVYEGTLLNNL